MDWIDLGIGKWKEDDIFTWQRSKSEGHETFLDFCNPPRIFRKYLYVGASERAYRVVEGGSVVDWRVPKESKKQRVVNPSQRERERERYL